MTPRIPRTPGRKAKLTKSSRAPLLDFETALTNLCLARFNEYAQLGVLPETEELVKKATSVITDLAAEAEAKAAKE